MFSIYDEVKLPYTLNTNGIPRGIRDHDNWKPQDFVELSDLKLLNEIRPVAENDGVELRELLGISDRCRKLPSIISPNQVHTEGHDSVEPTAPPVNRPNRDGYIAHHRTAEPEDSCLTLEQIEPAILRG